MMFFLFFSPSDLNYPLRQVLIRYLDFTLFCSGDLPKKFPSGLLPPSFLSWTPKAPGPTSGTFCKAGTSTCREVQGPLGSRASLCTPWPQSPLASLEAEMIKGWGVFGIFLIYHLSKQKHWFIKADSSFNEDYFFLKFLSLWECKSRAANR